MSNEAVYLNTVSDNKLECQNLPQIYEETTWFLFQMKCKGKHAEELQGNYEQLSCGGPDKESQRAKKCSKRKRDNRCIRKKAFKTNFLSQFLSEK